MTRTVAIMILLAPLLSGSVSSFDTEYLEKAGGYSCRRADCGNFEICSSKGDDAISAEIERILCLSGGEVAAAVGLEDILPVAVVIAGDTPAFRRLHSGRVPEWGEAFSDSHRMIIGIDASRVVLSGRPLRDVVRHELSHIFFAQRTSGARAPTWFLEGVAMRQSREWTIGDQWRLALMTWRKDTPLLDDLQGRFPRSEEKAAAAYRVSYAAVNELLAGRERDLVTLTAFLRDTGDFEKSFMLAFGETTAEFAERFSAVMAGRYGRTGLILQVSPYGLSLSALFLIAYFIKRQRSRRRVAQWEREEPGERSA